MAYNDPRFYGAGAVNQQFPSIIDPVTGQPTYFQSGIRPQSGSPAAFGYNPYNLDLQAAAERDVGAWPNYNLNLSRAGAGGPAYSPTIDVGTPEGANPEPGQFGSQFKREPDAGTGTTYGYDPVTGTYSIPTNRKDDPGSSSKSGTTTSDSPYKSNWIEEIVTRGLLVLVGLVLIASGFYIAGQRIPKNVTVRQLGRAVT